jgi:hypothetical protein
VTDLLPISAHESPAAQNDAEQIRETKQNL